MALPFSAITISPPARQGRCLRFRLQDYWDSIDVVLRRMCKSYILYPEFDDNGRLHFHGMVGDFDKCKYFCWKYKLDRIGFTCVKPITNSLVWMLYCQKNWRKTCKVFSYEAYDLKPLFRKNRKNKKEFKVTAQ